MAFLNNIKGMPVPPIKNVLKDVWQNAKESIPDRQRQEYDDPTSEYGGSSQVSYGSSSARPHNVHFADSVGAGGGGGWEQQQQPTEMNPLNPFNSAGAGANGASATNPFANLQQQDGGDGSYQSYQETSFNYQDGGFPPR
jgi:vesicular inhibitory amino acid transporter